MPDTLSEAYGREVPEEVVLTEDFDTPENCLHGPGVKVKVAEPPGDVELDECSLFVMLAFEGEGFRAERIYEHEFKLDSNLS